MSNEQKPSVGRVVHFFGNSPAGSKGPHAATITRVHDDDMINLSVVFDGVEGAHSISYAKFSIGGEPNTWCWPPRV